MDKTKSLIFFLAFLFILLPIASSAGESINFQYPSQADSGQAFASSIELINFSSDVYDVKIDIFNSDGNRIAQIFNAGTWRSTFYYVADAINNSQSNSSSFDLNITQNYEGIATINITIRGNALTKFGPYPLNVIQSISPSNQSEELNQTQNQTDQEEIDVPQNVTVDCTGLQIAKISEHPSEMSFGDSGELIVDFNGSCYNQGNVKMLVYGSASRIVAYANGTKITSYASCQQGTEFTDITSEDYNFDLPFYTYPNCDAKYAEGNYSVSLRVCDSNGLNYYEESFNLEISGLNASACSNQTSAMANTNSTDDPEEENEIVSLPESKSIKISGSANYDRESNGEVVYQSTEIKSVTIAAYLAGILFFLLCAYLIATKGKI